MEIVKKTKSKKEVILEAQRDKNKVHVATLVEICHLKNAELEPKLQKYEGRVVLRGDKIKDDSGAYAVLLSKARVPNDCRKSNGCCCERQAADAVSACTEGKMEDAARLLEILKSE